MVKIFTTTILSSGESYWNKVESTTKGCAFAWPEWQMMATIPRNPSPTPLAIKINMGVISLPVFFLPELEMNSTLVWLHSSKETSWRKALPTLCVNREHLDKEAYQLMPIFLQRMIEAKKGLLKAHHNIQRSIVKAVMTSCAPSFD